MSAYENIFGGGPCSEEDRRPSRPLTDRQKNVGFLWRLLCDAAFQQDTDMNFTTAPLCLVNFCWKSFDCTKWRQTFSLLEYKIMPGDGCRYTEKVLLITPIGEKMYTYADVSKHDHILVVEKIVNDLRSVYDVHWKPSDMGMDQRCIYALCATELHWGNKGHGEFVKDLKAKMQAIGLDLVSKEHGHFQDRLDIFNSISSTQGQHEENRNDLESGFFYGGKFSKASDFEANKGLPFRCCNSCKSSLIPKQNSWHAQDANVSGTVQSNIKFMIGPSTKRFARV